MDSGLYISGNALLVGQSSVDNISNNIANINTIGYKRTRSTFSDLLYQTIKGGESGVNPTQLGYGVKLASTDTIFNQGELLSTDKNTDVALEGDGFFMVKNPQSATDNEGFYFTRAGDFSFDADNNLVSPNGNKVVGWLADLNQQGNGYSIPTDPETNIPTGDIQPINIDSYGNVPAIASTYIRFKANLNSGSEVKEYTKASQTDNFNVLFDANGSSLNIADGDNFQVSYDGGTSWHTYEYDSNSNAQSGTKAFKSIDDLINSMNTDMTSDGIDAAASFSNSTGAIQIDNTSSTQDTNIMVRPTSNDTSFTGNANDNQKLNTIMENMNQVIPPQGHADTQGLNIAAHTIHSIFYDSIGDKHNVDVIFKKSAPNQWNYNINLPDADGSAANNTGSVSFDSNGGLLAASSSPIVNISLNNGANPVNLLVNLWNTDSGGYEGNQFSGITQFSLDSGTSYQTQDGSTSGELNSVETDYQGNINGIYSNGKSYSIAKLAVAKFTNPQGLKRVGNSMFGITSNTDSKSIIDSLSYVGAANQGGRGSIMSSHLEMSNADLSEEFTSMIVYQRGFQANSEGIKTVDQMIQTAIQLKR